MKTASLWIRPELVRQIVDHCRAESPREACGLLLGTEGSVSQVVPAQNSATDPHHRFRIDDFTLASSGHAALGFYHSHPTGKALPSRSDIQESCYSEHVYLILGLKNATPELAAWHFERGRVERVALHISNLPPDAGVPTLTTAHKSAIVVSVVLCMLIVIIVAWTLLPAAPPIP